MLDHIVIVIPAFNAADTIRGVLARIPESARRRVSRMIAVDDGSTDGTLAVLEALQEAHDDLEVLRHGTNRGYGAAEKTLLRRALADGADVVILLHADGQYSPEMIPELLKPFDQGDADLVEGSRMLGGGARQGGMPFYKYAANKALTKLENRAFGLRMAEYHSGYMLYSRALLERVPLERLSDSFDFDLEMLVCAHVLGMSIHEIAIPTIYAGEVSHLNPIRYGLDVLKAVRRYRTGYYHRLLGVSRGRSP